MRAFTLWGARVAAMFCAVVILTAARPASAHLFDVWYNPLNAPIMTETGQPIPDTTMRQIIMAALREIEAHSNGRMTFAFRGVSPAPPCGLVPAGSRGVIKIRWDPGLASCGMATFWQTCAYGDINLQPSLVSAPSVALTSRCADVRATITHEIVHYTRYEWNERFNSVLTPVNLAVTTADPLIADLVSRHMWNEDTDNTFWGWAGASTYVGADLYNSSNGNSVDAGITVLSGGASYTAALAPGTNGNMYSRVLGIPGGALVVQQGDVLGSFWPLTQQVWTDTTRRRACLTQRTTTGRMFVLWTDTGQVLSSNPFETNRLVGTRRVLCAESTNGGTVWNLCSPATGIPGVATRSGIGCTYDRANDRIVLAFSDNEEVLMTAHLAGGASGQWSWNSPQALVAPDGNAIWSSDDPAISFDPKSTANAGLVSWFDGRLLTQRTMWLRFSSPAFTYVFDSGVHNPFFTDDEAMTLRSPVVPLVISSAAHWAFNGQFPTTQSQSRRRRVNGSILESFTGWTQEGVSPRVHDWYTGSASNSLIVETAYLREGTRF